MSFWPFHRSSSKANNNNPPNRSNSLLGQTAFVAPYQPQPPPAVAPPVSAWYVAGPRNAPPPPYSPQANAAPPPYNPNASQSRPAPVANFHNSESKKIPNAKIDKQAAAGRDYVLLIDTSGSMNTEDCPNDNSRWKEAEEGAVAFAEMMTRLDPDGIDVALFNDSVTWFRNVDSPAVVSRIFREHSPRGGTVLAPVLAQVFMEWFETKKRPLTVVIVSDGQPNDEREVIDTIVATSKRLLQEGGKDEDIGCQFIQIGCDAGATRFLHMLDDDLQDKYGAPFDLVDTVPISEVAQRGGIKQVLIDAIND